MHVFLTGPVRIGKSTVISRAIAGLPLGLLGGFRTVSMATSLPQALAEAYIVPAWEPKPALDRRHLIGIRWGEGLYTAFPNAFETGGLDILREQRPAHLLLMDELGFMEQQAPDFCLEVLTKLDETTPVLGVIKPQSGLLLDAVRQHPAVKVMEVTRENRDSLPLLVNELLLY